MDADTFLGILLFSVCYWYGRVYQRNVSHTVCETGRGSNVCATWPLYAYSGVLQGVKREVLEIRWQILVMKFEVYF